MFGCRWHFWRCFLRNWFLFWFSFVVFMILFWMIYFFFAYITASKHGLIGGSCIPDHIRDKYHDDYYFKFMHIIPRKYTFGCFTEPPVMLFGNQNYWSLAKNDFVGPRPIPRPGEWQFSVILIEIKNMKLYLPYFAFTTSSGWHARIGCKWDDVDGYFVFFSIAFKRID